MGLLVVAPLGCDIDDILDCAQICNHKQECLDSSYDVSNCIDVCEDFADLSEENERRLEACEECIEDRACVETVGCFEDCPGIP
jgi:hypothetical protein